MSKGGLRLPELFRQGRNNPDRSQTGATGDHLLGLGGFTTTTTTTTTVELWVPEELCAKGQGDHDQLHLVGEKRAAGWEMPATDAQTGLG